MPCAPACLIRTKEVGGTAAGALLTLLSGYAGAFGYLAAMAWLGVTLGVMRPTALTLNIWSSLTPLPYPAYPFG